jgi:hypothetical protein
VFIFAFEWSHTVARIWLYAGLLATLVCLVLAFLDWKRDAERALSQTETRQREAP